ncbi:PEBP-like protein [Punctularia strigosozonata HHB-11173 SS5]|uniref:PEBP-like protein n=1 Tax=Punctularia strigosozonata (strain HHB-11173) TaxID=741275 RepID=UPI0004417AF4|nr:PEBP-like protein [Punctularia strigosozonata HHB-11173 SS5]EIN05432.1 PEBP-like protein [Punctularia strigosozonata HHB-11173 SS5]
MANLDPLSNVASSLSRESLIPDVVPSSFSPSLLFSVVWPTGQEALLGNELPLADVQDEPSVQLMPMNLPSEQADNSGEGKESDGETTYTLAMLDPDAPSRAEPLYKSFRHWVITGLKLTSSSDGNADAMHSRPATTPYRPPGPRPGSGVHRYTFLLFEEPPSFGGVPEGSPEYGATLEERRSWDAVAFGERYGLKLVGANFMLVRSVDQ